MMKNPQRIHMTNERKNTTQRVWHHTIVETQSFALQNEHTFPPLRAVWSMIDSVLGEEKIHNRRKKP